MKGHCFDSHGRYLLRNPDSGFLLVHGIVTGKGKLEGIRFPHCWLEKGDFVYDLTVPDNGEFAIFPKAFYYLYGSIEEKPGALVRYTQKEVFEKIAKHETYGYWDLEESLCDVLSS